MLSNYVRSKCNFFKIFVLQVSKNCILCKGWKVFEFAEEKVSGDTFKKSNLIVSDTMGKMGRGFLVAISYTEINFLLIGLTSWALFCSHKIYFYMFWPNLNNFFAEGHGTFLWKIGVICRELVTDTKKNYLYFVEISLHISQ